MDQSQREISAADYHCRICLEQLAELSLYCDCRSHLAAVHQECLVIHLQYLLLKNRSLSCEICKAQYNVLLEREYSRVCKNKLSLAALLFAFALISSAAAVLSYFLINRLNKAEKEVVLQTVGWIANLLLFILLLRLGKAILKFQSQRRTEKKMVKQVQPKSWELIAIDE